jgi:choline monooxygenase
MPAVPEIDPDIRVARTLPGWCYRDPAFFEACRERVLARSWQLVGDAGLLPDAPGAHPFRFLEGGVDEPLVLTRDERGEARVLGNVCTHRANLVVTKGGPCRELRCGYHGRRFALDGRFASMPEFREARDFPSPADDLPHLPLERWGDLLFTALEPAAPFEAWTGAARARLAGVRADGLALDPSRSRDYEFAGNWALYVDNYLEGFHIPFVHQGLHEALDYGSYATETFGDAVLQVGCGRDASDSLALPPDAPDAARPVAAYYLWLFPNLMLNFYPWGVSANVVKPLAPDRTRVSFLAYVRDASRLDRGAGSSLDRVEHEDEAIVEACQVGVRSRLYDRGRYSPTRERGVHHFHRLLTKALRESGPNPHHVSDT